MCKSLWLVLTIVKWVFSYLLTLNMDGSTYGYHLCQYLTFVYLPSFLSQFEQLFLDQFCIARHLGNLALLKASLRVSLHITNLKEMLAKNLCRQLFPQLL